MPRNRKYDPSDPAQNSLDPDTWTAVNADAFEAMVSSSGYAYFQMADLLFDCVVAQRVDVDEDGTVTNWNTTMYDGSSQVTADAWIAWNGVNPDDIFPEVSFDGGATWLPVVRDGARLPAPYGGIVYTIPGLSPKQTLHNRALLVRTIFGTIFGEPVPGTGLTYLAVQIRCNKTAAASDVAIAYTISRVEDAADDFTATGSTFLGCTVADGKVQPLNDHAMFFPGKAVIANPNSTVRHLSRGVQVTVDVPIGIPGYTTPVVMEGFDESNRATSEALAAFSVEMRFRVEDGWNGWGGPLICWTNEAMQATGFVVSIVPADPTMGDPTKVGHLRVIGLDSASIIKSSYVDYLGASIPFTSEVPGRFDSPDVVFKNRDHHLAVVATGHSIALYLDGRLAGEKTTACVFATNGPCILGWVPQYPESASDDFTDVQWGGGEQWFSGGYISEVRVWDRALSPTEINMRRERALYESYDEVVRLKSSGSKEPVQAYDGTWGPYGWTGGLVAYYPMNGSETGCDFIHIFDPINAMQLTWAYSAGSRRWRGLLLANGERRAARQSPLQLDASTANALFVTNAPFTFDWPDKPGGAATYLGVGNMGSIDRIGETGRLESSGIEMTLSGIIPALLSVATNTPYVERPCRIYGVFFDDHGEIVGTPIMLFAGRMQLMPITLGATSAIKLTAESRLVDWERPRQRVWTDVDQQSRFAGDKGFSLIAEIADKEIWWPAKFA